MMGWQLSIHFIRLPTSVILPTPHSYFSRATHSYTYTTQWREISLHRQFLSLSSSSPSPIEPRDGQEFSGQHDQTSTIRGSGHVYQFKKRCTRTPVSVIIESLKRLKSVHTETVPIQCDKPSKSLGAFGKKSREPQIRAQAS